ncbi:MAG: beta-ketoacyl-ACP synthase [Microcystis sp.]
MNVVVTGIGLISSLGNLSQSWQRLLEGKTGITRQQLFSDLPALPLGLIGHKPAFLEDLTKIALIAALEDAKLTPPLKDCGVTIGSSRGCQGLWEQMAATGIVENWLDSLPDRASVLTARLIETGAPVLAPMAACATAIWSIAQGVELIKMGECDRVLAGAIETPITPLTLVGFEQMGALAKTGCYPFDRAREGLVLGEGGAILVLESEERALSRNAPIYGQILGYGFTCDADHLSAPAVDNRSATKAIELCLHRSQLRKDEINYIHAHGTSTRLNDEREANLIASIFGSQVAVSSTKGATGHSLGASGALGVAFCLMALKNQLIPPCVGVRESPFQLNLTRSAVNFSLHNCLCLSFGFVGQNAAIAVGKFFSDQ